jgi:hypothetical protein
MNPPWTPWTACRPAFTRSRDLRGILPQFGKHLRGNRGGGILLLLEGRVRPANYAREVVELLGDL